MASPKKNFSGFANQAGNIIETLSSKSPSVSETAQAVVTPLASEARKITEEFVAGLFGVKSSVEIYNASSENKKVGNEIYKSGPVNNEVLLIREMERRDSERMQQLRYELSIILKEVKTVADRVDEVSEELEIAVLQAENSVDISQYQVNLLEKLLGTLVSFRKKIESAKVWLQSANARGAKKGWLANYKKHGAKYLLSGEHYAQRSAG